MWIKLHGTARQHPKIIKLAQILEIPVPQALGHMCSLWLWVQDFAPDGNLKSFDEFDIEFGAQWNSQCGGKPGLFFQALLKLKLLEKKRKVCEIHDWMDYAGSLIEAKRKRDYREKTRKCKKKVSRDSHGTVPGRSWDSTVREEIRGDVTIRDKYISNNTSTVRSEKPRSSPKPKNVVLEIPLKGDLTHTVTAEDLRCWGQAYPNIDILYELNKAKQWCANNTDRRKTKRGARRFLNAWLCKAEKDAMEGKKSQAPPGPEFKCLDGYVDQRRKEREERLVNV